MQTPSGTSEGIRIRARIGGLTLRHLPVAGGPMSLSQPQPADPDQPPQGGSDALEVPNVRTPYTGQRMQQVEEGGHASATTDRGVLCAVVLPRVTNPVGGMQEKWESTRCRWRPVGYAPFGGDA